jgi:hypothetical protein
MRECFGHEDAIAAAVDLKPCPCETCDKETKRACHNLSIQILLMALREAEEVA